MQLLLLVGLYILSLLKTPPKMLRMNTEFMADITASYHAFAQAITLWQFNGGHNFEAVYTAPLEPLGTANSLSITYLYQAYNYGLIVNASNESTSTITALIPTPRTIVASASGWVELFGPSGSPTSILGCSLINSDNGNCFYGPPTSIVAQSTAKPFAEVVAVNAPVLTTTVIAGQLTPASSNLLPSSTAQSTDSSATLAQESGSRKHSPAGAIAGGVIGGCAGLSAVALGGDDDGSEHPYGLITPMPAPIKPSPRFIPMIPSSKQNRTNGLRAVDHGTGGSSTGNRGGSNSDSRTTAQTHNLSLTEISDRLRRLEVVSNSPSSPPPTYHEERADHDA
ncbi:hypothetical protein GYMLUDRAFT_64877 [Collybiopsis luxurians FD-317 M1]|uniref:Uncharacterized protein n=1 Tax=Collybiopsis luxurians FD-317 M1 TaxID=944289 RepID=A0A0D0BAM7_9AGAR|nr:hypothetical protein GYMLUDRAFT_64877 [Collybiopsis luxurians FD-317 M1]